MDDIYDDLENYEDVNDVTELKNENNELKQKLEENSIAMNQLQKDFEKLNSEYKKLELNYSSLLKTARAEIERKGEMIKNLNTEKDKLIINALQTKGKCMSRNSNNFNGNQKNSKDQNNYANKDKGKQKQNCVDSKDKSCGNKNNRLQTGAPSPISSNANENKTTTNATNEDNNNFGKKSVSNTEIKENKTTTKTTNVDKLLNIGKKSVSNTEMKENISKNEVHSNKTSSQRISNRRKSMPAASFQEEKFSSDEEADKPYSKKNRITPPNTSRHDNRDYRTDIHSHCSTDSSRSRNSNNFDHNTPRHNDYDMKRYHRNYSPERYQHKYIDYNRVRVVKSPPSDKYNRSKSRDRRYNYERDHDRHRHYETSSLKHKIRNSFDEPNSKRQKTELYSKCPSQDSNYISDREKEFSDRRYIVEPEFEQISCQSPDYIHSDSHFPQHLIKEIRNIAATSLEDPRISSKKYFLHSHNGQKFLFIPSARDIDILCIDKMLWGLQNVKLPEPLKSFPCSVTESENYLNQIYNNMDEIESIESGEILSLEDDVTLSKAPENYKEPNLDFNRKSISSNIADTGQKINKLEVRQSSSTCGYKMPEIKKNQECSNKLDKSTKVSDDINVNIKKSKESNLKLKESDKKSKPNEEKHKEVAENVQVSAKFKKSNNSKQSNIDKTIQDKIRTVEGDLELSDEESDTMEFQKEIEEKIPNSENNQKTNATTKIDKPYKNSSFVEKKETDVHESQMIGKKETDVHENQMIDKKETDVHENQMIGKKETDVHENQMIDKKRTDNTVTQESSSIRKSSSKDSTRDSKKRRSKKKSESKETTSKDQKDKKKSNDKNNKKIIPEQTVNKFSDLFGDTSSLITPDDLGIPMSDNKSQDVTYALMFENTQNAMNLNVQDVLKPEIDQSTHQLPTNTNFNTIIESVPNKEKNKTDNEFSNINISNSKCEMAYKEQQLNDNSENPKGETSMEKNNVVKTVIISTGIQPHRDNNLPDLSDLSDLNVKNSNEKDIIKKDALNEVHVLATSTPYKSIVSDDKMITSQNSDTINTNDVSIGLSSSNFNTNQIEDVPEFKIILRRKRKVIRKPT